LTDKLVGLDGVNLGDLKTVLLNVGPGRASGERRFALALEDEKGATLDPPVIEGLYFEGFGRWYRPWLEVRYNRELSTLDLGGSGEEEALFKLLCSILPPGSHIMVPYRTHRISAMALMFGVPPAASPLGYLMYVGGCRWYKDWYFAEGFMEGEEKLQATKPLDDARRRAKTVAIRDELRDYLSSDPDPSKPEMETICRDLARRIIDMPDE
jgi:hypothetical protein